jgi:hypothetical protein
MPAAEVQLQAATSVQWDSDDPDYEEFKDIKVRLAAHKRDVAADPDAEAMQQHVARLLRASKDAGDEITDAVEERAYVTAISTANNRKRDRARPMKVAPYWVEEFPEQFVLEPPSADDLLGSEVWALEYDPKLILLDAFTKRWMGQPLPKFGEDVSQELGRSPEWRQKTLRRLYHRSLWAS